MATEDTGIHPEVMKHIIELHRKHTELQMQLHDKHADDDDSDAELTQAIHELTAVVKQLMSITKADVDADRSGKRKGARGGNRPAEAGT